MATKIQSTMKTAGVKNAAVITHGCNPELVKSADLLRNPDTYVKQFKKYQAVISPDASLYWDAPFAAHHAIV